MRSNHNKQSWMVVNMVGEGKAPAKLKSPGRDGLDPDGLEHDDSHHGGALG